MVGVRLLSNPAITHKGGLAIVHVNEDGISREESLGFGIGDPSIRQGAFLI